MNAHFRGFFLAAFLGLAAFFIGSFMPSFFNSYLIALLLGMTLSTWYSNHKELHSGVNLSAAKLLEFSVVILAFSMNYKAVAQIGYNSFWLIGLVVIFILLVTYYLSKLLSCPGKSGLLIGFGTAICGSSAIAALAPKINAKEEDVAISLAVVNLYGSLGMLLLPLFFQLFPQSIDHMAFVTGASLHSVGNVAGAGYAVSDEVGQLSLMYKMARVALLSPALVLMAWFDSKGKSKAQFEWKLPWYLFLFILISIFVTIFPLQQNVISISEMIGKVVLTIAMAAIGLKVNFFQLLKEGRRGLVFALIIFILQISLLWLLK